MATLANRDRALLWAGLLVGAYLLVPDPTSPVPPFLAFTLIVSVEIVVAGAENGEAEE
jgi:hypothetical protein